MSEAPTMPRVEAPRPPVVASPDVLVPTVAPGGPELAQVLTPGPDSLRDVAAMKIPPSAEVTAHAAAQVATEAGGSTSPPIEGVSVLAGAAGEGGPPKENGPSTTGSESPGEQPVTPGVEPVVESGTTSSGERPPTESTSTEAGDFDKWEQQLASPDLTAEEAKNLDLLNRVDDSKLTPNEIKQRDTLRDRKDANEGRASVEAEAAAVELSAAEQLNAKMDTLVEKMAKNEGDLGDNLAEMQNLQAEFMDVKLEQQQIDATRNAINKALGREGGNPNNRQERPIETKVRECMQKIYDAQAQLMVLPKIIEDLREAKVKADTAAKDLAPKLMKTGEVSDAAKIKELTDKFNMEVGKSAYYQARLAEAKNAGREMKATLLRQVNSVQYMLGHKGVIRALGGWAKAKGYEMFADKATDYDSLNPDVSLAGQAIRNRVVNK